MVNFRFPFSGFVVIPVLLALSISCKPASDDSEVKALGFNPGASKPSTAVDPVTVSRISVNENPIVFNLAEVIRTKAPSYKNHIAQADKVIFLTSDADAVAKKRASARLIKVDNAKAGLKTEKFRTETNFVVTTNMKKSVITGKWHLDAWVLERLLSATAKTHSAEILLQSGFNGKLQAFATATVKIFGAPNAVKNASTKAPALDIPSKNFTLLSAKLPIFGIPKLGVRAGVSFKGAIGVEGEVDFSNANAMSVTFVPNVSFGANLTAAKVEAGFASAEVGGAITIIKALFPASMSVGGRGNGLKSTYASFQFKTPKMELIKGNLYLTANLKVPSPSLPSVIEKAFWFWVDDKAKAASKNRLKVPAKWKFVAVLWEPKDPMRTIDIKGDQGSSAVSPQACAADLNTHAAGIQKDATADKGMKKSVSMATVANLKAMAKKANGKSCAGKTPASGTKK